MEQVCRRWIIRLRVAIVFLSLVLPSWAHPGAAGSAGLGLGMSRKTLQAVFARQALAFTFEDFHESRGMPIVSRHGRRGESPSGSETLTPSGVETSLMGNSCVCGHWRAKSDHATFSAGILRGMRLRYWLAQAESRWR
jgi:hypothetical protein